MKPQETPFRASLLRKIPDWDHLRSMSLRYWGLLFALALVVLWAHWPTFRLMADLWANDPQYSHGFLVPVFAGVVLWSRWSQHAGLRFVINPWGLALIGLGAVLRLVAGALYYEWLDSLSLLPTLIGITVLFGDWKALRWSWPALGFLFFMMPVPYRLKTALAAPLQQFATVCSTYLLQTVGQPAVADGNVILVDEHELGVAEACSGLGMLFTFFALSTAIALIVRRSKPEKWIVFGSAVPIALIVNVLRITLTGILYVTVGEKVGRFVYHDLAGWLMMPLALGLLWLELRLLARLFVDVKPTKPEPIPIPLSPHSLSPSESSPPQYVEVPAHAQ